MQILDSSQIPYLTAEQMLEVDRLVDEVYGIQLIHLTWREPPVQEKEILTFTPRRI